MERYITPFIGMLNGITPQQKCIAKLAILQ